MHEIIRSTFQFYGLDWATMILGLTGTYMLSNKDKRGFAVNTLACICSLSVALLSGQNGFIVYNLILMGMMLKGFKSWQTKPSVA